MRELALVVANEWMKLLHRRRFWVTGILMLLVVGLFGLVTWHEHRNQTRYNPVDGTKSAIVQVQSDIARMSAQPASTQRDQNLQMLKTQLTSMQQSLAGMEASQSVDWRAPLQQQAKAMQSQIKQLSSTTPMTPDIQERIGDTQLSLMGTQYNLDHNIRPQEPWISTAYQQIGNFEEIATHIFLPLLVVILMADMVSGEATDGTVKLLLVRPVSRMKILLGKWIVSLFGTVLMSVVFFAGIWLTAAVIDGPGGALQPAVTGVTYSFAQYVPTGQTMQVTAAIPQLSHAHAMSQLAFYLDGVLVSVLAMMVVATVAFLCSALLRSAMVSTAGAMGVVVIGFIVEHMAQHESWIGWVFTTHLNLWQNWSGELSRMTNQNMTLPFGVGVLVTWAVISLALSLWWFSRRDVLNA